MVRRVSLFLWLILTLLISTSGCGGNEPVNLTEIPVFPDAIPLQSGENTMADLLAESIVDSAGVEGVNVDMNLYHLSPDTGWDQVHAFFEREIRGNQWMLDNDLTEDSEAVSTLGWTRGEVANEQALLVAFAGDPFGGPPLLIVMLFSE